MIVRKPEEVVEAELGSVILVPIEILNQTKWPWKRGCILGLADRN